MSNAVDRGGEASFAVLGGAPAFDRPRHVGRPNLGDRERLMARIEGVLDRVWLTNGGPLVQEFEAAVAAVAGVRHCVATCNGTLALEIAIRAAGLSGEVITTPFTFVATPHALRWQGITPVFADVDPRTHNVDPRQVERLITPRTTGILGVHLWGRACPVDELAAIADRHGLTLLLDASHAFGCSSGGRMVGGFGTAETFSFHATKFVNSFEGGAIVTDDDAFAERARLVRNFGFADYDQVQGLGTNGKMSEVAAAMGLTSLESRDHFVAVNHENYAAYRAGLAGIPGIELVPYRDEDLTTRQYVVVEVDGSADLTRDDLYRVLWAENVLARRYFHPGCHRMEPYRSEQDPERLRMPETDRLATRTLTLPTGTGVDLADIAMVCDLVRRAMAAGRPLGELVRAQAAGSRPVLAAVPDDGAGTG
ncbi:aminotransferase class I/II-fold pyridoxal phosphate-dependent enzyme [Geodermatophilus maliterrae]|uniref:Aminotransferase class I/II-fold pyridoxal phosphate-dependent enzyme n=1 Tax=Geodermatophilus maliterrae TaxID=3162531 RepID=A0ABV3XLD0_9ACTN